MSELAKALREAAHQEFPFGDPEACALFAEAADEVADLEAALAEAERGRDAAIDRATERGLKLAMWQERAEAVERERDEARAALRALSDTTRPTAIVLSDVGGLATEQVVGLYVRYSDIPAEDRSRSFRVVGWHWHPATSTADRERGRAC